MSFRNLSLRLKRSFNGIFSSAPLETSDMPPNSHTNQTRPLETMTRPTGLEETVRDGKHTPDSDPKVEPSLKNESDLLKENRLLGKPREFSKNSGHLGGLSSPEQKIDRIGSYQGSEQAPCTPARNTKPLLVADLQNSPPEHQETEATRKTSTSSSLVMQISSPLAVPVSPTMATSRPEHLTKLHSSDGSDPKSQTSLPVALKMESRIDDAPPSCKSPALAGQLESPDRRSEESTRQFILHEWESDVEMLLFDYSGNERKSPEQMRTEHSMNIASLLTEMGHRASGKNQQFNRSSIRGKSSKRDKYIVPRRRAQIRAEDQNLWVISTGIDGETTHDPKVSAPAAQRLDSMLRELYNTALDIEKSKEGLEDVNFGVSGQSSDDGKAKTGSEKQERAEEFLKLVREVYGSDDHMDRDERASAVSRRQAKHSAAPDGTHFVPQSFQQFLTRFRSFASREQQNMEQTVVAREEQDDDVQPGK